ncbi:hypothetical protein GCM10022420_083710 [Streptomyces iranensis]|uniref:DNA-binding NarL/FixJ family response regulator n=2 Tax=Streptomyces iranensis TaxID=576784 RepID=A0A060ZBU6_9ACTN|nr:DNA-binding NarL/FixJ family response regulator [Streptomyces iranensis]CDR01831.1 two component transcriptional regulator, LuxRfamily [Streptomyces iranensis]
MFGITYPVMAAPMGLHSGGTLAAAVSAAGGLGSFAGTHPWQAAWRTGPTPRAATVVGRLVLVARGLSNADIAEYLHLSHGTVKTHIGRLLSKLEARDRAQLVISAYESGLVTATGGS